MLVDAAVGGVAWCSTFLLYAPDASVGIETQVAMTPDQTSYGNYALIYYMKSTCKPCIESVNRYHIHSRHTSGASAQSANTGVFSCTV